MATKKDDYRRKTLYFKQNQHKYDDYLKQIQKTTGEKATDYICRLIEADMTKAEITPQTLILGEIKALNERINNLQALPTSTRHEAYIESEESEEEESLVNDEFLDMLDNE